MALTDAKIRAAKPTDKAYKLTDGAGMFLLVHPNGSRYWRLRYRILGKEKTLALGVYPEVSLSEARTKRDEARKLISEGVDPCEQKRAKKVVPDLQLSFEHIARRWHASNKQWAQSHSDKVLKSLETHVFPFIGNITINLDDHIQSVQGKGRYEDEMFIIKYFKKGGSAHITFKRLELIDRINDIIARHFPSVLSA